MNIKQKIKVIKSEMKTALRATWNVVKELEAIERERSYKQLEGYENSTFRHFLETQFNMTIYKFNMMQKLTEKYKKTDFNRFGSKLLNAVEKTENPELTLKEMIKQATKERVISITSMRKIINMNKSTSTQKPNKISNNPITWLKSEIPEWVKNGYVTFFQAEELKKIYGIKKKKRA